MKGSGLRLALVLFAAACLVSQTASYASAQGQSGDKKAAKQEMKQLNKEANKTGAKAEETADQLGRKVVFCILAAHTTGVGTAEELKGKFDALTDFPFGQFVAAVLLADRIDKSLDSIIADLVAGMSIGQITKAADVNMGEIRSHFGQFRSELARSLTNPPTKDCLTSAP
jgi:S-methylmethionine-dependent homocysteine/selenocysteine methylase